MILRLPVNLTTLDRIEQRATALLDASRRLLDAVERSRADEKHKQRARDEQHEREP